MKYNIGQIKILVPAHDPRVLIVRCDFCPFEWTGQKPEVAMQLVNGKFLIIRAS